MTHIALKRNGAGIGIHLVVQILILARYPLKPSVHLFMPLFKFPVCWVVSNTQRPNEEHCKKFWKALKPQDGSTEDSKCLLLGLLYPAADFPPWGKPMRAETHLLRRSWEFSLGYHSKHLWLHLSPQRGRTSLTSADSLLISSSRSQLCGTDGSTLYAWAAHVSNTQPDKRGRKSLSTCRAGEGSTCLWHLQRSRFHWCYQL